MGKKRKERRRNAVVAKILIRTRERKRELYIKFIAGCSFLYFIISLSGPSKSPP